MAGFSHSLACGHMSGRFDRAVYVHSCLEVAETSRIEWTL